MHRTGAAVLLVALLVVTAGCNGLFGSNDAPPQVTPAAVPTDTPPPTPVPHLAPGLTKYGLTNASALIDASTKCLANTSFTVREVWTLTFPNGTVAARRVWTTQIDGKRTYTRLNSTGFRGDPVHHESWAGNNLYLNKIKHGGSVSYNRIARSGPSHAEAMRTPGTMFYRAFVPERDPVVERLRRNGTTLYQLENTYPNNSNSTISARIDPCGVIRRYSVQTPVSAAPVPNASFSRRSIRVTDIGTTTVERPVWYGEAINQTTPVNRPTATTTPD